MKEACIVRGHLGIINAMQLRPYQEQSVADIRRAFASGRKSPLLVSPTGSGKTVLFAYVTAGAERKGNRVMVLAHRAELIDQISGALQAENVPHGFIAAGYPKAGSHRVIVASVQTLVRRLTTTPAPDLIICDEAHHCTATNTYGKIFAAYPGARRLGVTATACRLSGEALGDVFDSLVLGPSVQALTDAGFLARARIFAPPLVATDDLHIRAGEFVQSEVKAAMDKPSITGDVLAHYKMHADNLPAVCFCYSIDHSRFMAQAFRDAGYVAAHLDGNISREIRREMIADFRSDRLRILCSVDVISEGFDVPGIHCGILARPTASETTYLQQVGRCLRPAPGKDAAILLDACGNVLRHGLPIDDRQWSLTGREKSHRKSKSADDISVKVCPQCFAAQRSGPPRCGQCGHVFEIKARQVTEKDGELRELTPEMVAARRARRDVGRAKTREELEAIAKARNYASGWVDHILQARVGRRA